MNKNANNPWAAPLDVDNDLADESNEDLGNILNHEFGWSKRRPQLLKFDWSAEDIYDWFF